MPPQIPAAARAQYARLRPLWEQNGKQRSLMAPKTHISSRRPGQGAPWDGRHHGRRTFPSRAARSPRAEEPPEGTVPLPPSHSVLGGSQTPRSAAPGPRSPLRTDVHRTTGVLAKTRKYHHHAARRQEITPLPAEATQGTGARVVQGPAAGAELPKLGHQRDADLDLVRCPAGNVEQRVTQRAADQFGVVPVRGRAGLRTCGRCKGDLPRAPTHPLSPSTARTGCL